MVGTPIPPRLHVILARESPLAIVIRRGPSKQTRLTLWNRSDDTFTPGQWLKARVYERRCDLSPDGQLFVYFALTGRWDAPTRGAFTAISRPPYFTALSLWPKGDAWNGGGLFTSARQFWLCGWHDGPMIGPNLARLDVTDQEPYPREGNNECLGTYFPRLRRDGWSGGDCVLNSNGRQVWRWEHHGLTPVVLVKLAVATISDRRPGQGVYYDEHELTDAAGGTSKTLPDAEWADVDLVRRRIVYASSGRLWEVGNGCEDRELFDFRGMSFDRLTSPADARDWPEN